MAITYRVYQRTDKVYKTGLSPWAVLVQKNSKKISVAIPDCKSEVGVQTDSVSNKIIEFVQRLKNIEKIHELRGEHPSIYSIASEVKRSRNAPAIQNNQIDEMLFSVSQADVTKHLFCSGVYILYYKEEIVYIGEAKRLSERLYAHSFGKEKKKYDVARYIPYKWGKTLFDLEDALIAHYKPKKNKKANLKHGVNLLELLFKVSKERMEILHQSEYGSIINTTGNGKTPKHYGAE